MRHARDLRVHRRVHEGKTCLADQAYSSFVAIFYKKVPEEMKGLSMSGAEIDENTTRLFKAFAVDGEIQYIWLVASMCVSSCTVVRYAVWAC
jgi:hypothetical protein